ncbi:hypothetical protein EG329_011986 [Mollisiaceae sp. DMI_Dod_QoI]|nr:hypothetical protein EG329_011986 [Helotiales sp. DMI_Dod_QoI]
MSQNSTINTADGLFWHIRQSGIPENQPLILIPSEEGDSYVFTNLISHLSPHFHITSFDMPGFSRTTGSSALTNLSLKKIATQIVTLMNVLKIPAAAFWGSSSGGLSALALLKYFPDRVRNVIVHEVPYSAPDSIYGLQQEEEETTVNNCKVMYRDMMNADPGAWDALGQEYHQRLAKNYTTWIRHYVGVLETADWEDVVKENAKRVSWSVGGQMPMGFFF